jgi:hypothetical protein
VISQKEISHPQCSQESQIPSIGNKDHATGECGSDRDTLFLSSSYEESQSKFEELYDIIHPATISIDDWTVVFPDSMHREYYSISSPVLGLTAEEKSFGLSPTSHLPTPPPSPPWSPNPAPSTTSSPSSSWLFSRSSSIGSAQYLQEERNAKFQEFNNAAGQAFSSAVKWPFLQEAAGIKRLRKGTTSRSTSDETDLGAWDGVIDWYT